MSESTTLDIDLRELPDTLLTSAYILSLLAHHDWDDFSTVLKKSDVEAFAPDQHGTIDLDVASKKFKITLPTINNKSTWTYVRPGSEYFAFAVIRNLFHFLNSI